MLPEVSSYHPAINKVSSGNFIGKSRKVRRRLTKVVLSSKTSNQLDLLLPTDPIDWNRSDVTKWLVEVSQRQNLPDLADPKCFPFNGKALLFLSVEMFISRSPSHGKLLYRDFQLRLAKSYCEAKVPQTLL